MQGAIFEVTKKEAAAPFMEFSTLHMDLADGKVWKVPVLSAQPSTNSFNPHHLAAADANHDVNPNDDQGGAQAAAAQVNNNAQQHNQLGDGEDGPAVEPFPVPDAIAVLRSKSGDLMQVGDWVQRYSLSILPIMVRSSLHACVFCVALEVALSTVHNTLAPEVSCHIRTSATLLAVYWGSCMLGQCRASYSQHKCGCACADRPGHRSAEGTGSKARCARSV